MSILEKRNYKIKKENGFKIPSIGMIRSWTVKNSCDIEFSIDGLVYNLPYKKKTEEQTLICMKKNREIIQNPEIILEETNLYYLEDVCYHQQIMSLEYYRELEKTDLFTSLFTQGINICIKPLDDSIEELNIEEEYWKRK